MKELLDLFSVCLDRYNNYPQCDENTCQLKAYCTATNCGYWNCINCINHIQRAKTPQFHYACNKITYHYVLILRCQGTGTCHQVGYMYQSLVNLVTSTLSLDEASPDSGESL